VVAQEILARKLVVEYDDRRRIIIGHDDVSSYDPPHGRFTAAPDLPGRFPYDHSGAGHEHEYEDRAEDQSGHDDRPRYGSFDEPREN
jgi:hypothetical protein